jgi:hypothetical protein
VGDVTMRIKTADNALDHAHAQGFIEAAFTPTDSETTLVERDPWSHPVSVWGSECDAAGRHTVIVGHLPAGFFVMLVLCADPLDKQYSLEQMRQTFRRHFGCEPRVDVEVPEEEVWTSSVGSLKAADAAARELVAIDRQKRDDDLEVTFGIMTS